MDASTSQDITDPFVPAECPNVSQDFNGPTVSEQLQVLTTQVDQLRITSEEALEQTKPLIRNFPITSMNQFEHLHAVQHLITQLSADLTIEEYKCLKLHANIRQREGELAHLRRQVDEPSPSPLTIPFTIDPSCSTAFQGNVPWKIP